MMKSPIARSVLALVMLAGASMAVQAARSFVTFSPANSVYVGNDTIVGAMNASGAIIGSYSTCADCAAYHGFLRTPDGTITTFDPPKAVDTYPNAINTGGTIAGNFGPGTQGAGFTPNHGFLRYPEGHYKIFDPTGSVDTMPMSINKSGQVAGFYYATTSDAPHNCGYTYSVTTHGFLRDGHGDITSFDPPGSVATTVSGINDAGLIVGSYCDASGQTHGFLRNTDGSFAAFLAEGSVGSGGVGGTHPIGIDFKGDIAGYYTDSKLRFVGFVRAPDGTITSFTAPGETDTAPEAVSGAGAIVGWCDDGKGNHGFVRAPSGRVEKFDVPGGLPGGTVAYATNGQQVSGTYFSGPNTTSAFVMTR